MSLKVTSKDRIGNVDPTPAVSTLSRWTRHLPHTQILSPRVRDAIQDSVVIIGSAADARFKSYGISVKSVSRYLPARRRTRSIVGAKTVQVSDGTLGVLARDVVLSGR